MGEREGHRTDCPSRRGTNAPCLLCDNLDLQDRITDLEAKLRTNPEGLEGLKKKVEEIETAADDALKNVFTRIKTLEDRFKDTDYTLKEAHTDVEHLVKKVTKLDKVDNLHMGIHKEIRTELEKHEESIEALNDVVDKLESHDALKAVVNELDPEPDLRDGDEVPPHSSTDEELQEDDEDDEGPPTCGTCGEELDSDLECPTCDYPEDTLTTLDPGNNPPHEEDDDDA